MSSELNIDDIPEGTYVSCPIDGWGEKYLKHCFTCEHCNGLIGIEEAMKKEMPFEKTFKVNCAYPVPRKISRVY